MSKKREQNRNGLARRMIAGLLSLVMLCGLLPASVLPAFAVEEPEEAEEQVSWAQDYMDKLVSWGVMRGDIDGNMYPDRDITRAEFVTMINRAYGYEDVGEIPFTDVSSQAWYADDIAIAYNVGYFAGTSETTASPEASLTREQAALLLGRNMMLQETRGETLGYSDSREFSEWSRNMMRSITNAGIIDGYPDGSFRPQKLISRGEVACMLAKAIGTPIQEGGVHTLGGVYGNVTINTPGVTLRNTTIAGDLYLTGGIGLGDVLLENVKVLGRIVTSGAGESNAGDSSILLRNVQADEMIVDNISNQFVTVRAEGDTSIGVTSVRTPAYLEDVTRDGFGLKLIKLDGEEGTNLQLAGNIKEVINQTPGSRIVMAQGVAKKITVDEKATGTGLSILNGARAETVNLDVGASVSGDGDIEHLVVNAPGSTISMLPDTMTVRPGISANIGGENMDTVAAAESSADPRLLAGYPAVRNIAPESATAVFSTNKKGTVYWALSALADGSVSEKDLMTPPAYGGSVLQSGTISAAASKTEYTAALKDLVTDGSYYVTTMLVDNRGQHSPVKVAAFTTPDDTVPAFAEGYPRVSKITSTDAQVTAMTNKSCMLYYALLPKGSTAPKAADFRTGAITGNLGYGSLDMVKNSTQPFQVNSVPLEEQVTYDLYLWLTDYDNAKSSEVVKLEITTVDGTPPIIRHMDRTNATNNSITMTFSLNEPGVVFWGVVKEGSVFYTENNVDPTSEWAKIYVTNGGVNSIARSGNQGVAAATAETDVNFTINNLEPETAYHIYYVARDTAGNYSEAVEDKVINTLDGNAPTVKQEFTQYSQDDAAGVDTTSPLSNTSIRLVFSEGVQGVKTDSSGQPYYEDFLDLYQKVGQARTDAELKDAKNALANALRDHFELWNKPAQGQPVPVADRSSVDWEEGTPWVIDYREAMVTQETVRVVEGDKERERVQMVITFPNKDDTSIRGSSKPDGLNLDSGATYYIKVSGIADTSEAKNKMMDTQLPNFTTRSAEVFLSELDDLSRLSVDEMRLPGDPRADTEGNIRIDMSFSMDPQNTGKSDESIVWDALLWADTPISFTLYSKAEGDVYWKNEGDVDITLGSGNTWTYRSLTRYFRTALGDVPTYEHLRNFDRKMEYAIHVYKIVDREEDANTKEIPWTQTVNMRVTVVAGNATRVDNLSTGSYQSNLDTALAAGVQSIGVPDPFTMTKSFTDEVAPEFVNGTPTIKVGDTKVQVTATLDRPGTVYYVAVPIEILEYEDGYSEAEYQQKLKENKIEEAKAMIKDYTTSMVPRKVGDESKPLPKDVPMDGSGKKVELSWPGPNTIVNQRPQTGTVWSGVSQPLDAYVAGTFNVENLLPDTLYYLYLVTKGESEIYSTYATCYCFATGAAVRPVVTLRLQNPSVGITVDIDSDVTYLLVVENQSANPLGLFDTFNGNSTYLNALTTTGSGNYSLFDDLADDAQKKDMEEKIRNTQQNPSTTPAGEENRDFSEDGEGRTQYINFQEDMVEGTQYILLVMARSKVGSGYSFRAIRPVRRLDTEPPRITACNTSLEKGQQYSKDFNEASHKGYKGELTVSFDKILYALINVAGVDSTLPVYHNPGTSVVVKNDATANPPTTAHVDLGYCTDLPVGKTSSGDPRAEIQDRGDVTTSSLRFSFNELTPESTITVNYLSSQNSTSGETLTLTMKLTKNSEDYWVPYFVFTPDSWRAESFEG